MADIFTWKTAHSRFPLAQVIDLSKKLHFLSLGFGAALFCMIFAACTGSPQARRDRYLARGKHFLDIGDPTRALIELRNAAGVSPNDAEIYYQTGVAYQKAQDLRSAVLSFQKALALDPKHAAAQLRLAEMMAAANDKSVLQEARTRLEKIVGDSQASVDALDVLAISEIKLGKPEDAVRTLERSMDQFPGELNTSILLARTKWYLHDKKGAEEALKKACEQLPQAAAAHQILGQFYFAENRLPEAETELRLALQLDSKSGPALESLARLHLAEGNLAEAARTYQLLAALPGYQSAYGLFLFRAGKSEDGLREFERVVRENPGNRELRTDLIVAYRALKRPVDIDRVLGAALEKNPKDIAALEQRAEVSIGRGDYRTAETDLDAAAHFLPSAPEPHYFRAQIYRLHGETRSYRQELSETLRLAPFALSVRIELACSMMSDKGRSALDVLDGAAKSQKSTAPYLAARNWALYANGDLAEMRNGIDAGLALGRSPEFLVQDGLWKLHAGDAAAAQALVEEALKIVPDDLLALQILNQTFISRHNAPRGLAKAKEYAARAPESAPIQIYLGQLLLAGGNLEQARSSFLAARSADPKSSQPDLALTQVDYRERKYDDARVRLEGILSTNPNDSTALLWMGIIEQVMGDRLKAIGYYRKVVASNPDEAQACNNLAYLLTDEGGSDLDEALKYAQRATELAPQSSAYADTLGWILYRRGLYSSAVKYLQQAGANSGDVRWMYHLAMAYAKAGDYAHSQTTLVAALKTNSNVPEAKLAVEVVQASH
jgi:tetratricopeptide (TPR) repeat protein